MLRRLWLILLVTSLFVYCGCSAEKKASRDRTTKAKRTGRLIVDLNGTWEIAQGSMDSVPDSFEHKAPVPGLVDMAEPAFEDVGKKSERRQAFWYRREFTVDAMVPDVALLKIHKAKYGTKVFLNGVLVGEHLPCFTPALLDVRESLKGAGERNELVVRIGADRESMPEGTPTGWDFEKYLYIPGIYDSVELILAGLPYILNVQTVPDIENGKVKIVAEIDTPGPAGFEVHFRLREVGAGGTVRSGAIGLADTTGDKREPVSFDISIADCHLWSPEYPFLYELELWTAGDNTRTRFGMRSFRFDKESGRAILNGKPYYMRGTNVCAYRFFEDAERGDKPWREEWVRRLHRKFKGMHWNSIRYCIGFPPEIWYEIADEEGFLIQDEFPIWLLNRAPEKPTSDKIIPEYKEWMRERWNHPCVVIWDAQNESVTDQTGEALRAVRHLDLSNRPWENGWADPQSDSDFAESHPYLFIRAWSGKEHFRLKDMSGVSGVPHLRQEQKERDVPIVINEYAWLWLNRDGTPTTLTKKIYEGFFPEGSTTEQRRVRYARYLAALTEFWRCHRECAGVLHFCGLGYSRAGDKPRPEGGATSDHFIDLEELTFEPYFEQYVRDAFSPVGLMIDFWADELAVGSEQQFEVYVINDLYRKWTGAVSFSIARGGEAVSQQSRTCSVDGLGREILSFALTVPDETGEYQLVAELVTAGGNEVRSLRDFKVVSAE
ncbi:MAG: glycoside hydrolase family 2 TIM barrel-domain containing protein [Planctomycetota bacterium]|nr:glycoside hydrolase family 2 TIM barrel-domain containing protein [Planctomycetota bacterium]